MNLKALRLVVSDILILGVEGYSSLLNETSVLNSTQHMALVCKKSTLQIVLMALVCDFHIVQIVHVALKLILHNPNRTHGYSF